MAAPATVDIKNISGVWQLNKELTGSLEEVFVIQNMGWMLRKTLGMATITLTVTHYTEAGVEKIDIDQTLTGGLKGSSEYRILDWTDREHTDHIFGTVASKSKRVTLSDSEIAGDKHFTEGWTADTVEAGVVLTRAVNEKEGWTATQVWGFVDHEDKRRYIRRLRIVGKGGKTVEKTLYYDYVSAPAS